MNNIHDYWILVSILRQQEPMSKGWFDFSKHCTKAFQRMTFIQKAICIFLFPSKNP